MYFLVSVICNLNCELFKKNLKSKPKTKSKTKRKMSHRKKLGFLISQVQANKLLLVHLDPQLLAPRAVRQSQPKPLACPRRFLACLGLRNRALLRRRLNGLAQLI
tara:strand:- start:665 stop:979 length:315 start_codon:yes stop_codon:yes gene_type:complete